MYRVFSTAGFFLQFSFALIADGCIATFGFTN